ncbi:hypothetical protein [Streptococcus vestibularis]|jgi:hypothetical protein|uniref:hypothetical protein n=2 Tax=Streptococcus TaxID=1301 RepID=UPI001C129F5B|nr:hypothetical protein [Streptococcus vestibularis]
MMKRVRTKISQRSSLDYKELVEDLVGHDESGSKAVYAERIHDNLSDYQPEDSSDSSNKLSGKDK